MSAGHLCKWTQNRRWWWWSYIRWTKSKFEKKTYQTHQDVGSQSAGREYQSPSAWSESTSVLRVASPLHKPAVSHARRSHNHTRNATHIRQETVRHLCFETTSTRCLKKTMPLDVWCLKIGPHLPKLLSNIEGYTFFQTQCWIVTTIAGPSRTQ